MQRPYYVGVRSSDCYQHGLNAKQDRTPAASGRRDFAEEGLEGSGLLATFSCEIGVLGLILSPPNLYGLASLLVIHG